MRRVRSTAPFILLMLTLAGAAAAAEHPGKALFDAAGCRSCHRIGAAGGNSGPDLTMVGFRRSRGWLATWLKDPKAWKPDTLMPDLRLPPAARAAVADYLSTLKGQEYARSGPPWDRAEPSRRGRMIYERAGCVACHGAKGAGGHPNNNVPGGLIPPLVKTSEGYTPEELKARIRRGMKPAKADPEGPDPLVLMPAWGQVLKDGEIEAVAAYVLALGPARGQGDQW